ncbi:hypothetical protein BT93_F1425 [Corymbia citriodora subsp. variegata]|nr:hypothetical protein BT93_F1425 [Corymbia citriodora subsp. variegata]
MVSTDIGKDKKEIEEPNDKSIKASNSVNISVSRRTLLSDEHPEKTNPSSALSDRLKFLKFGSASVRFKRMAEERDEISRSVASCSSGHRFRERFNGVFSRKIDWGSLMKMSKEWIRDPMNMVLFVWIAVVAVSGAILFLVMTGMLNSAIPKTSERNVWFEVNNQILNALFTLMCLYQHPKRFYHLVLLCRWRPEDISKLRKIYCKNGTYKPHEWAHMMVVVILLHINCFAQYALCGLNLGYKRTQRPALGVGICISVAIAAPAFAGVYCIISPLGKDYDSGIDEEAQVQITDDQKTELDKLRMKQFERRYSFAPREDPRIVENRPMWSGGILDFWEDISLAYLSLFCSFCVFGWNMERLGFGNMYVHIATFVLFCIAPFWIFNLAALNIDNETVREALSVTGVILCLFGLLYGGFWRIQMRKRYNLPPYKFCCGKPAVTDCALWLFCCWCSLAQEVRTGNSYDVAEEKFCIKQRDGDELAPISPLPNEDRVFEVRSGSASPAGNISSSPKNAAGNSPSPSRFSIGNHSPYRKLNVVKEEPSPLAKDEIMSPPAPLLINKEAL